MNQSGTSKQLAASPFYKGEEEYGNLDPAAKRIAHRGNMFHKWQPLLISANTEESIAEEGEQVKGNVHQRSNTQEPKSTPIPSLDEIVEVIGMAAAIESVTERLSLEPRIMNKQVNWVDKWDESTYKEIGIEGEKRTFSESDTLFEQIRPLYSAKANPTDQMKESKFLRWLKDKEAKRQGFSTIKERETKKKEKGKKKDRPDENNERKRKESKKEKKKKKKELKKILKKSLKMEEEIISETLADVMVQQGHIQKAKKMYEKLSLIFPEKSSYFAGIIGKLEEE